MRTHFTFLASSYHGWLIVTPDELAAVGLSEADITPYSYRRGDHLGLEEDEDAQTFLAAYKARFGREAEIMRRLLSTRRQGASDALTVRLWRELIADSLARQGPFSLHLPQCRDLPRLVETARFRFGSAPPITSRISLASCPKSAPSTNSLSLRTVAISLACGFSSSGMMSSDTVMRAAAAVCIE